MILFSIFKSTCACISVCKYKPGACWNIEPVLRMISYKEMRHNAGYVTGTVKWVHDYIPGPTIHWLQEQNAGNHWLHSEPSCLSFFTSSQTLFQAVYFPCQLTLKHFPRGRRCSKMKDDIILISLLFDIKCSGQKHFIFLMCGSETNADFCLYILSDVIQCNRTYDDYIQFLSSEMYLLGLEWRLRS